jgi:large subunit ribosomal protein L9
MAEKTKSSKPAKPKAAKEAKPTKAEQPAGPKRRVRRHQAVQPIMHGDHGGYKLLLVEDVAHLGKMGDIVEVRPGYARNYLLPRGMATLVSDHNLRLLERHREKVQRLREAKLADLRAIIAQLEKVTVTIESIANEEGHLYGSVGAVEISKALKAMNLMIEPDAVRLEGPIKEVALYAVKIHLAPEIETEVKVLVVSPGPEKK